MTKPTKEEWIKEMSDLIVEKTPFDRNHADGCASAFLEDVCDNDTSECTPKEAFYEEFLRIR